MAVRRGEDSILGEEGVALWHGKELGVAGRGQRVYRGATRVLFVLWLQGAAWTETEAVLGESIEVAGSGKRLCGVAINWAVVETVGRFLVAKSAFKLSAFRHAQAIAQENH